MTAWYTFFKQALFRPAVKWWFRVKLEGVENIPDGGCVLAANHLDAGDTFSLPALIDPPVTFPAKKELFQGKGFKRRVVAWFLRAVGQAPIDRSGGKASASGLGSVEHVLASGGVIGIFPEGTRSPDGRLYRGHTGVARLTLDSGKPVLPVAMVNTHLIRSRIGIPTMRGARIVIGKPIDFGDWAGQGNNQRVLRWVTNEVMAEIQQLTGQEYVDVYASRVKRGDLKDADLTPYMLDHPNSGQPVPPRNAELPVPQPDESSGA
ncbi:lysophospholipid acyltransferase family protein [Brooklawnia cerclae]|uniref:1-acyl-sn-glycerol-3-phosphate acyltransferase n=1 Tax=Brooklawnia cerclae TaxID=349934 RepID=A0ABX0SGL6_9ACTN|nr:1-acyl-sn-glycerol-3-phosphate acyltransferase [Brooklawnia cerclae]